ncbi:MAG TPA: sulfate permease [Acidimicrobiia bacterium]|nr:sulfate permease [Acidimicrobiia bacterium]
MVRVVVPDSDRLYQRRWLRQDLLAGIVLAALLVPQGMAYAELAGLPPETGLYTSVVALLAYALLGSSRVLVLGPDSALGPLIAAAILPLVGAHHDPSVAVADAGMLALLMGALCIAAGLARFGILAELLSKPVRVGFLNGVALVVLVSQLAPLFGFRTSATGLLDESRAFVRGVADGRTVPAALLVGVASLAVVLAIRRWWPKVPGILIAFVGATVVTGALDLAAHGVPVVGSIPSGFPAPSFPNVSLHDVGALVVAAAGMAFVSLADTTAVSRSLAAQRGERVDANREIVALGAANAAAGLFQGFPVSTSATRTALAESAGSRTQLAPLVSAGVIVVVLLVDGGLTQDLPQATLAAIVIAAGLLLFDVTSLRWFWRVRRSELYLSVSALLGVAILGVLPGIAVAIALSLGDFVRRAWRPYDAVLGRIRGRKGYHDVDRHPEAEQIPGLVLYRFDAPLFFANAELFADRLLDTVSAREDATRWVIVAAEPVTDVDTSGADMLGRLLDDFHSRGMTVAFAELKGPVKDRLRGYGLVDRVGADHFYPTVGTAVHAYLTATGTPWVDWSDEDGETDAEPA